jgi:hypothetical protein
MRVATSRPGCCHQQGSRSATAPNKSAAHSPASQSAVAHQQIKPPPPPADQAAAHQQIRPSPLPGRSGRRQKTAAAPLQARPPPATTGPRRLLPGPLPRWERCGCERAEGGKGETRGRRPERGDAAWFWWSVRKESDSDLEVSARSKYCPNIRSVGTTWFPFQLCTKRRSEARSWVRPMPFHLVIEIKHTLRT